MSRICCPFGRVEPRRRAEDLVRGLASDLPVKNCWTIGEHVGSATPDGLQHLLRKAVWDHDGVRDGVRDDLRGYVVDHLGSQDGVLVVDLCRHRDYAERSGVGAGQRRLMRQVLGIIRAV